jgi:hypothetical protein
MLAAMFSGRHTLPQHPTTVRPLVLATPVGCGLSGWVEWFLPLCLGEGDGVRGQGREALPARAQLAQGRCYPRAVGVRLPATAARGRVLPVARK